MAGCGPQAEGGAPRVTNGDGAQRGRAVCGAPMFLLGGLTFQLSGHSLHTVRVPAQTSPPQTPPCPCGAFSTFSEPCGRNPFGLSLPWGRRVSKPLRVPDGRHPGRLGASATCAGSVTACRSPRRRRACREHAALPAAHPGHSARLRPRSAPGDRVPASAGSALLTQRVSGPKRPPASLQRSPCPVLSQTPWLLSAANPAASGMCWALRTLK